MKKLEIIQKSFDATCLHRRSGRPKIQLTPAYYSIYSDGLVIKNSDVNLSLANDPERIICFVSVPFDDTSPYYKIEELFGFINLTGELTNELVLSKWAMSKIVMADQERVLSFEIHRIDNRNEKINFVMIGNDAWKNRLEIADLWVLFTQIESNCETSAEANIYFNYFFVIKKIDQQKLTLKEYRTELLEKNNIINQYKELLQNIDILVKSKTTESQL